MRWLTNRPIAHRGLHDRAAGIIENSPSAIAAAIAGNYAIEVDLQLSKDGEAMVFHDAALDRLTTESGKLRQRTAAELKLVPFKETADRMPTLGDLLAQTEGRVPLVIELKTRPADRGRLEARTAELLRAYPGPAAVMSFDPGAIGWFAKNAPTVPRGQISMAYKGDGAPNLPAWRRFLLRHLLMAHVSRPHFIAYDINALPAPGPSAARLLGLPLLTWTVRTAEQRERARRYADNIIFEGFRA